MTALHTNNHTIRLIARSLAFVCLTAAAADSLGAASLGYADGFNVFVFSSLRSTSDIGGRAAAGTTLNGVFDVGTQLLSTPERFDLIAGSGVADGSHVKVNSQGKAYVPNGVAGVNVITNGNGQLVTAGPDPIDFDSARTYYYQLSSSLSQLEATGTIQSGQIDATGNGLNVFNLSAGEFLQLSSISTTGGTVLINVAGTPGLNQQNMLVNGQQNVAGLSVASNVLFNFYGENGTLTLPNVLGGSVLAPWATVSGSNQFNGTIVANALDFTGEIHGDGGFNGSLPAPVPEPAGFGITGLALGCGALWYRKHRSASGSIIP